MGRICEGLLHSELAGSSTVERSVAVEGSEEPVQQDPPRSGLAGPEGLLEGSWTPGARWTPGLLDICKSCPLHLASHPALIFSAIPSCDVRPGSHVTTHVRVSLSGGCGGRRHTCETRECACGGGLGYSAEDLGLSENRCDDRAKVLNSTPPKIQLAS
ncbi:hypothetical protein J6590_020787 [Homalodisca vitripennis]|nr:hypothetical protein J6590_020787 [Homalodisca vitripennis]